LAQHRQLLGTAQARHNEAVAAAQKATAQLGSAQQEYAAKRSVVEEIEGRWVEAQAAILAHALIPGHPCPVCGSPVQRIRYAENEANYCATCQTGGRVLADRGLSRLLREDWPRSLEEWEAKLG
jgi:formamidopyrimidine-DNA glycosylase